MLQPRTFRPMTAVPDQHPASRPPQSRLARALDFARRVGAGLYDYNAFDHAATMSFYFFLGLIPLMVFAGFLLGLVVQERGADTLASPLFHVMPASAARLVREELKVMGGTSPTSIAPLSLLGFLILTSNGIHNLMDVFELVTKAPHREWWKQRLLSIAWVFGCLLVVCGAVWLVLALDKVFVGDIGASTSIVHGIFLRAQRMLAGTWASLGAISFFGALLSSGLATFYRFSVQHPSHIKRVVWPGTFAAIFCWVLVSWVFGQYVAHLGQYAVYYGSLATVAVLLVWLYLTSLSILLGAEVNAQLEGVRDLQHILSIPPDMPASLRTPLSIRTPISVRASATPLPRFFPTHVDETTTQQPVTPPPPAQEEETTPRSPEASAADVTKRSLARPFELLAGPGGMLPHGLIGVMRSKLSEPREMLSLAVIRHHGDGITEHTREPRAAHRGPLAERRPVFLTQRKKLRWRHCAPAIERREQLSALCGARLCLVERADLLAHVAPKQPAPDALAQLLGHRALLLDGEERHALARFEHEWPDEGLGWARVETASARSAALGHRDVRLKCERRHHLAEQQVRALPRDDDQAVLAHEAQPRSHCPRSLQHGRRVDHRPRLHTIAQRSNERREPLQPATHALVIVPPSRITRHARRYRARRRLLLLSATRITHCNADDALRALQNVAGIEPPTHLTVVREEGELAVQSRVEERLIVSEFRVERQICARYPHRVKAQLLGMCADALLKIWRPVWRHRRAIQGEQRVTQRGRFRYGLPRIARSTFPGMRSLPWLWQRSFVVQVQMVCWSLRRC